MIDSHGSETSAATFPFHTYLWKIASRCNLNCTYCYIYNSADSRWKDQPHFMSEQTARQTAARTREHLLRHDKHDLLILLHGGEPLLGGRSHLEMLLAVIDEELRSHGFKVDIGIQSNLVLLTRDIADFLLLHQVKVGTSLDGPPEWTDKSRRDHAGRPTSERVERQLRLLMEPRYKRIYAGILCVINIDAPAAVVLNYLLDFAPPSIDFLFPLNNHDNPPAGKTADPSATPYGDWLINAFDNWWAQGAPSDIRLFGNIMRLACGLPSNVESMGTSVVDLIVVETNGDIEGVDSLKSTFNGATVLGCNVFQNDFDTVAKHPLVHFRQIGMQQLCAVCKSCPVVKICGGGYIPHRYSVASLYDNPSVYCRDLEKIIRHIHTVLSQSVSDTFVEKAHV